MLPAGAIFKLKIHRNAYAASPRTHWGAYRTPRPLASFQGATSRQGRGGKGKERVRKGGEEEKGRGSVPPLFLQFNDCSAVIVAATYTRSLDSLQLVCSSVCRHHAD